MKIFTVAGKPFGKQRPRHSGKVTYTPKETRMWEDIIASEYIRQCGGYMFPSESGIKLMVFAYFPIPKGFSKAKREAAVRERIRPSSKPDWDNIGKLVSDALNGVAYADDKMITEAFVGKYYSEEPRTVVYIEQVKVETDKEAKT